MTQTTERVFVHCSQGKDRTGLLVGLYRVHVQGWNPQQAYNEMLSLNFDPGFVKLKNFFWNNTRTGDIVIPQP